MDVYEKIANDHQAQIVTTSWYLSESVLPPAYVTQEETIFKQMKAQGQTMLASLGDAGFYVNQYSSNTICTNLFLDENMCHHFSGQSPAVQGLVTAVGGTSLFLNADGTYNNEVS